MIQNRKMIKPNGRGNEKLGVLQRFVHILRLKLSNVKLKSEVLKLTDSIQLLVINMECLNAIKSLSLS